MNVTPTAGIAAAWSAAKTSPNDQAARFASSAQSASKQTSPDAAEPKKGPPAPEGQGTQVDIRV